MRTSLALSLLLATSACSPDLRAEVAGAGVYSPRRVVVGNAEVIALGQMLFFDRELSGNRNIACATCHLPSAHAVDARHLSVGQDGARLSRSSVELFNRGTVTSMFWDGRLELRDGHIVGPVAIPNGVSTLLEAQALLPLLDRHEMRGQPGDVAEDGRDNELAALQDDATTEVWDAILARLVAIEGYRTLFAAAFPGVAPGDLTIVHVARAIAAFEERLWELTDTSFDDYLGSVSEPGRDGALTDEERRGAELFFGDAGCARCHGGPLLSDGAFHAIGVPQIGPGRDAAHQDEGRFLVTGEVADRFAFRTPPLRNVAITAPYMHDGAYDDLEQAVRHHLDPATSLALYDSQRLPADLGAEVRTDLASQLIGAIDPDVTPYRGLSDQEIRQIVIFLGSLTSRTELSVPLGGGAPQAVPSGLPVDLMPAEGDTLP